ncbi:MAG: tetratricopeptide repeat protein [Bacteroidales bacterium]
MQRFISYSTFAMMMVVVLLMLAISQGSARNTDTLFNLGLEAYKDGEYHLAGQHFETLIRAGINSADVHYNLGNCRFRQKRFAEAILHFERALKITPGHANAKYNLNLANSYIKDEIRGSQQLFLITWWKNGAALLSSAWWLVLHILLFIVTLILTGLFLVSKHWRTKRIGYITAIVTLSLSLLMLAFSIQRHYDEFIRRDAIIMSEQTTVRSGPGLTTTGLVDYHAGTKVRVIGEDGEWYEVITADGHIGWIAREDAEII